MSLDCAPGSPDTVTPMEIMLSALIVGVSEVSLQLTVVAFGPDMLQVSVVSARVVALEPARNVNV